MIGELSCQERRHLATSHSENSIRGKRAQILFNCRYKSEEECSHYGFGIQEVGEWGLR